MYITPLCGEVTAAPQCMTLMTLPMPGLSSVGHRLRFLLVLWRVLVGPGDGGQAGPGEGSVAVPEVPQGERRPAGLADHPRRPAAAEEQLGRHARRDRRRGRLG